MRKQLLIILICLVISTLFLKLSIQLYFQSTPCVVPDGCQCSLTSFEETIKDQVATCEYLRITQDPNSGIQCTSQKDEKTCAFPVHCGVLEGGCDDYDCDTDDVCLEDGRCLYTPKHCRNDDGCCPKGCIGWDNDCLTPEGCVENCKNDCTKLCAGFTELKYFMCDFCSGEGCVEKCDNAKEKQEYMCDVCEPSCDISCTGESCDDSFCNGTCSYSIGEPCWGVDPDCYNCLKNTCNVEKGYCNNCVWDKNSYCSKCNHVGDGVCNCDESPGTVDCQEENEFCIWEGNCVTLNACWDIKGPYCGEGVSCTCPSETIRGSGCRVEHSTGSFTVSC